MALTDTGALNLRTTEQQPMQSKKRCLLALGLLTCLMDVGATAGEKGQDFISKDQSAAWAQASSATISDIGWMRAPPR